MFKPLKNRVLLKIQSQEKEALTGLIIVNKSEKTDKGLVLAVGTSVQEPSVGETVLIQAGAGVETPDGRLIADNEILAVL